jgi:hypothetical protein
MRHELVVPALVLERGLVALIRASWKDRGGAASALTGAAFADTHGSVTVWTVPRLDPSDAPAHRDSRRADAVRAEVWWAPRDLDVPQSKAAWHAWLVRHSPEARPVPSTERLALVVGEDGIVEGVHRRRDDLEPIRELRLPGPGMRRLVLGSGSKTVTVEPAPPTFQEGRFSRLAGALGEPVLADLQRSVIAVIGCGRTGSAVAHTLARHGIALLLVDPDIVEDHNAGDGDLLRPGLHEGRSKAHALAAGLRPLLRPGTWVDARRLDVRTHAASMLIAGADVLISCADYDRARQRCARIATAHLLPHIDVGVGVPRAGDAGFDVRLASPGAGCLACIGGFATLDGGSGRGDGSAATAFRTGRRGSLRSLNQQAAHLAVRLLEQLFDGRAVGNRFVQWTEDARTGRIAVRDEAISGNPACRLCNAQAGRGRIVDAA